MDKNRLALKRSRKALKRKRLSQHRQRVGMLNYYKERNPIICASCKTVRKIENVVSLLSPTLASCCKFCIKENVYEEEQKIDQEKA